MSLLCFSDDSPVTDNNNMKANTGGSFSNEVRDLQLHVYQPFLINCQIFNLI